MSVPSNLIPTRITALPEYEGNETTGWFPYAFKGKTYKLTFDWMVDHGFDLSNELPLPLGANDAGIGLKVSRFDHVHPALDLADGTQNIGVLPVIRGGSGATTLDGYLKGNGVAPFTGVGVIPITDVNGTKNQFDIACLDGDFVFVGDPIPVGGLIGTKAEFDAALTDGDFVFVGDPFPVSDLLGTKAQFDAACLDGDFVFVGDTIPMGDITGTKADFNAALTDGAFVYVGDTIPVDLVVGAVPEAPIDGLIYVRKNADWIVMPAPPTGGLPEAPTDGSVYGRKGSDHSWQPLTGPAAVSQRKEYTAVEGQTDFATDYAYVVGYMAVYVNGVRLANSEFSAPGGTAVTLATGVASGDTVLLEGFIGSMVPTGGGTVTSVDASGGTTGLTFSGGPITASGVLTLGGALIATHLTGTKAQFDAACLDGDFVFAGGAGSVPVLTPGSVAFAGASGAVTEDNTQLFWDDATNRLGIGTKTPAAGLHVDNSWIMTGRYGTTGTITLRRAEGSQAAPTGQLASTVVSTVQFAGYDGANYETIAQIMGITDGAITSSSSPGSIAFNTTSPGAVVTTERMRITSAGYVGIGATSPSSKLHVQQAVDGEIARFQRTGGSNIPILRFNVNEASNLVELEETGAAGGAMAFRTGAAERMRIDSAGHVGVGTATPQVALHIKAAGEVMRWETPTARGGGDVALGLFDPTGQKGWLGYGGSDHFQIVNMLNNDMSFWTNSFKRMHILADGTVGIGLTPVAGASSKLQLNNDLTFGGSLLANVIWDGSAFKYVNAGYALAFTMNQSNGNLTYSASPASGAAGGTATVNTYMTILANGKIGLGSTPKSPSSQLVDIGGEVTFSGPSSLIFNTYWNGSTFIQHNVGYSGYIQYDNSNGQLKFYNSQANVAVGGSPTMRLGVILDKDLNFSCQGPLWANGGIIWLGPGNGVIQHDGTNLYIRPQTNGNMYFGTQGNNYMALYVNTFYPTTDGTVTLGQGGQRWAVVYAANGTIQTSDAREKRWRGGLTPEELAAAKDLAKEIGVYQWLSSLEEKGEDARLHVGILAQTVEAIMTRHGLDPAHYGFWCYDEWEEKVHPGGEGSEDTVTPAGNRYSVRYDELWGFVLAGQEQRLAALEALL